MENLSKQQFGGKTRIRVMGICVQNQSILLIKHHNVGNRPEFWSPPGGGVHFQERTDQALVREFAEETGLEIVVKQFAAINEFCEGNLHALELIFHVEIVNGTLQTGTDPEFDASSQIIKEVKFVTFDELMVMPDEMKHNVLNGNINEDYLLNMSGHFKLWQ